ncbi:ACP S-malonyltransferase [Bacillus paramycoides]|uniref:ACP S-malonyltransferase n=1 Tax=Bacillus paramycoides TaxID=2026194 RepID=UPI003D0521C7
MEKIALLFPGQGSQYTGMGKIFYEKYPIVKDVFEEASDILGYDIKKLCFEGEIDKLTETRYAQPTIFTVSVAMFKAYMEEYARPPYCLAGHSLGEISALTCSGAIRFCDGLKIVKRRGELMHEAASCGLGGMIAVGGIDRKEIENVISQIENPNIIASIACYNSQNQIAISGNMEGIWEMEKIFTNKGASVTPLKVSAPFHSVLMSSVAEMLEEELLKYEYFDFKWPVISNVNAKIYKTREEIIHNLKKQIVHPVLWAETIDFIECEGVNLTVEIGPKNVLRNLMKRSGKNICSISLDKKVDKRQLDEKWLSESQLNNEHNTYKNIDFIKKCVSISLCTKNSNYNDHEYTKGVIEPLKDMKKLLNKHDEVKIEEMYYAIEMLMKVLRTKEVSNDEKKQRLNLLLKETHDTEIKSRIAKIITNIG